MRDKRTVDDLSIEELERVLAIRRRKERQQRLKRMRESGRVVESVAPPENGARPAAVKQAPAPPRTAPIESNGHEALPAASITAEATTVSQTDLAPRFEDELAVIDDETPPAPDPKASAARKRVVNGLLLLVEIAAVIGLIVMGAGLFIEMGELQQESAEAQRMANEQRLASVPTPAPTSTIQLNLNDFVLPGGHTFDENGQAVFNLDEVPTHLLRSVPEQVYPVSFYENFRRPEETEETALYVNIPKLQLDQSIVQGSDWDALKQGVGQVLNGATPGSATGNLALAAHNDIYGELFRDLDQLEVGDEFYVQTRNETFTYRVTGSEVVEPNDVHVLQSQGQATATLISCYPYGVNSHRYIVYAERVTAQRS